MDVDELKLEIQEAKKLMSFLIKIDEIFTATVITMDSRSRITSRKADTIVRCIQIFKNETHHMLQGMKQNITRLTNNTPECPEDCEHREGRHCKLGANHCTRRAEDFYKKK